LHLPSINYTPIILATTTSVSAISDFFGGVFQVMAFVLVGATRDP